MPITKLTPEEITLQIHVTVKNIGTNFQFSWELPEMGNTVNYLAIVVKPMNNNESVILWNKTYLFDDMWSSLYDLWSNTGNPFQLWTGIDLTSCYLYNEKT